MTERAMIWLNGDGVLYFRIERPKAVLMSSKIVGFLTPAEIWVPRSVIGTICYQIGGDSKVVKLNQTIRAIELAEWWSEKHNLGL